LRDFIKLRTSVPVTSSESLQKTFRKRELFRLTPGQPHIAVATSAHHPFLRDLLSRPDAKHTGEQY